MSTVTTRATPLVVVQNNLVTKLTEPVARACQVLGITLHDLSSGDLTRVNRIPPMGTWGPILVIGSIAFTQQWAEGREDLNQWIFWNDAHYDPKVWTDKLGDNFLNAHGRATTVRDFTRLQLGEYFEEGVSIWHVRPRSEKKLIGNKERTESQTGQHSIPGHLTTPAKLTTYAVDPDVSLWVSRPRDVLAEVRLWMIGGHVAGASTYRVNGADVKMSTGTLVTEAEAVAVRLHHQWHPDRHYVIDLALCPDGVYRVVEYNPIHAAGWYAANPADIITAYLQAEQHYIKRSYHD